MATYPARSKSITRLATRPVTRLAVGAAVHGSVPGQPDQPPENTLTLGGKNLTLGGKYLTLGDDDNG